AGELEDEVRNLIFQIAGDVVASNDAARAKLLDGARDGDGDLGIGADVIGLPDELALGIASGAGQKEATECIARHGLPRCYVYRTRAVTGSADSSSPLGFAWFAKDAISGLQASQGTGLAWNGGISAGLSTKSRWSRWDRRAVLRATRSPDWHR